MEKLPTAPWTLTSEEIARDLDVDFAVGLTDSEVQKRREKFGYNELTKEEGTPLWKLILEQFDDALVKASRGSHSLI